MKITRTVKSAAAVAAFCLFFTGVASAAPNDKKPSDDATKKERPAQDNRTKKVGKVTALNLDAQTNEVSVTVTVGTLNKIEPTKADDGDKAKADEKKREAKKGERPEIITLGNETATFTLGKDVKVVGGPDPKAFQKKGEPKRGAKDGDRARNGRKDDKFRRDGNNAHKRNDVKFSRGGKNERRAPARHDAKKKNFGKTASAQKRPNSLNIGELVTLVYSEDGSKVEAILPLLPPFPPRR